MVNIFLFIINFLIFHVMIILEMIKIMEKSVVFFTKDISPEGLVKLYEKLGIKLDGMVAVKLHSGEEGNQNYVKPEFVKPIIEFVNGTVVECNTAYDGARNSTEKHKN